MRTYTGDIDAGQIPVVISSSRPFTFHGNEYQEHQALRTATRERNLIQCPIINNQVLPSNIAKKHAPISPPSLYLINPTSIVKPHALQHLTSDAMTYDIDIIVVAETWMKAHHSDQVVEIPGYTVFRRDRKKRRGGGVAVYVKRGFNGRALNFSELYDDNIELLWISATVQGRSCYIGAVYHPPKPTYPLEEMHSALERSLESIYSRDEDSLIILAGDFNQLQSTFITSIGLVEVFVGPTHAGHDLDRIYATENVYSYSRAIDSSVSTKHKAVVVRSEPITNKVENKTKTEHKIRLHTPVQHAALMRRLATKTWQDVIDSRSSPETMFNAFYDSTSEILDEIYPTKTVTVSNRDPYFVTPSIKALLRKRNKLMHKNKIEAANALTSRIRQMITKSNTTTFNKSEMTNKELWEKVRIVSGSSSKKQSNPVPGITADLLNNHYASISTDMKYIQPTTKPEGNESQNTVEEFEVFRMLDNMKSTSAGLDGIPYWYLRVAAPFISKPIAHLFNLSISHAYVPKQWKTSIITPAPKSSQPGKCEDFRPISVTSILCRTLEKIIIRRYLYPVLVHPEFKQLYQDQFAFRPTGSTTAALINLLQKITVLLEKHEFVHLIGLDFSKAFDSVRHSSLINKITQLPIPNNIHNWLVEYLDSRSHCTKFNNAISKILEINASFVQGSLIGPIAYVLNTSDLRPLYAENDMNKYADDTYLIVPSSNSHTVARELEHVTEWAVENNLKLNCSKSVELIIHKPRTKIEQCNVPPPADGVTRLNNMKILGVIITDTLSFEMHISGVIARCAQTSYALKFMRAHGLNGQALWDVTRATLVSKLTYASPVWFGFLNEESKRRCQAVLSRMRRLGYLGGDLGNFSEICAKADEGLFRAVTSNPDHVLHRLLPPVKDTPYQLRPRPHNFELPFVDNFIKKNIILRMLYYNSY